jgi:cytochrome c biogenesis protein CcdA
MEGLTATGTVIAIDMGIYWFLSMIVLWLLDLYASKKLGGKRMLGYKVLRFPKFFSLVFVSGYTIVLVLMSMNGIEIKYNTLTYLGLPYFIVWIFYLVNVLRRVKAETKGRPWR